MAPHTPAARSERPGRRVLRGLRVVGAVETRPDLVIGVLSEAVDQRGGSTFRGSGVPAGIGTAVACTASTSDSPGRLCRNCPVPAHRHGRIHRHRRHHDDRTVGERAAGPPGDRRRTTSEVRTVLPAVIVVSIRLAPPQ